MRQEGWSGGSCSAGLLGQTPPPEAPGTQVVSDITYIPTREGWLYLVFVLDLFSRVVLGWKISDSMHSELVTDAIRSADRTGLLRPGTIFHSDRGCQYTASATRTLLAHREWIESMSAADHCYDNAFAESAFATFKAELPGADSPFETKARARLAIFDCIESFYNRRRRHSSLGMLSPLQFLNQHFQSNVSPNQPQPHCASLVRFLRGISSPACPPIWSLDGTLCVTLLVHRDSCGSWFWKSRMFAHRLT